MLASMTLAPADVPLDIGFLSLDLSAMPIPVTAGELLAIVLRAETETGASTGSPYMWGGTSTGNPYAAGKYFTRTETYSSWTALEDVGSTVPDLGFRTEITVAYATVSCDLGSLDVDASTTVTIETTAPGYDTYLDNSAAAAATSIDPNLENNYSSARTTVGSPPADEPPADLPDAPAEGCDCRGSSPPPLWLSLGLAFGWCRRRVFRADSQPG